MRSATGRVLAAAGILLAAATGCASSDVGAPRTASDVVIAMAEETFPTRTPVDWVTYADHVVVATAVDESETVQAWEDGNPPGERSVRRDVALRVDERVWSSADPRQRAPAGTFSMEAMGSVDRDGGRTRVAIEDTPRVEVGHTYVIALIWRPAVDDPTSPSSAHWEWLGMDALLPYDDGTIGVGELEGTVRTEPLRVPADDVEYSFEDELAGRSVDDLVDVLVATDPVEREDFG